MCLDIRKTTVNLFHVFVTSFVRNYCGKILPIYYRAQIDMRGQEERSVVTSGEVRQSPHHLPQQTNIPHSGVRLFHARVFVTILILTVLQPCLILLVFVLLVLVSVLVLPSGLVVSLRLFLNMTGYRRGERESTYMLVEVVVILLVDVDLFWRLA